MTHPNPDPLHVPEAPVRRSSTTDHISVGPLLAILLVTIAVLVILAASRGGSNPGQLHGAGLTGSVLREAPRATEGSVLGASLRGTATWYCGNGSRCTRGYGPSDMVAAIDTGTGFRRGDVVTVRHAGRAVTVRIVDVCGCTGARVIDLTTGAFRRLAPLSRGVIPVTLSAGIALPATDAEGER